MPVPAETQDCVQSRLPGSVLQLWTQDRVIVAPGDLGGDQARHYGEELIGAVACTEPWLVVVSAVQLQGRPFVRLQLGHTVLQVDGPPRYRVSTERMLVPAEWVGAVVSAMQAAAERSLMLWCE
jgi:hypothetical protein